MCHWTVTRQQSLKTDSGIKAHSQIALSDTRVYFKPSEMGNKRKSQTDAPGDYFAVANYPNWDKNENLERQKNQINKVLLIVIELIPLLIVSRPSPIPFFNFNRSTVKLTPLDN